MKLFFIKAFKLKVSKQQVFNKTSVNARLVFEQNLNVFALSPFKRLNLSIFSVLQIMIESNSIELDLFKKENRKQS